MKKNIYIIAALTILNCVVAKAQEDKIYGGFKIAPNYSLITDKADKWKSGVGFSIGYFEVLELNNKLNLQAEVNYSRYKFSNEVVTGYDNSGNPTTSSKNKIIRSLEIPVMAKYRVNEQFAIGLGYQLSLGTKVKDETGSLLYASENGTGAESLSDDLKKIFGRTNSTNGIFVDASFKSEKVICGLRILQTNKALIDDKHNAINGSFYVAVPLF